MAALLSPLVVLAGDDPVVESISGVLQVANSNSGTCVGT
jgi:hypothetical protein